MKITKLEPNFSPIQITIETAYEADLLRSLFALTTTVPDAWMEAYDVTFNRNDKNKLKDLMSAIHDAMP
jgi:hypothetical protein